MNYFDYEYRVRYGDTDKLGISYYANYFVWFEAARTEYFRALGLPYTECEKKGYFLPVVETGAHYHASCTYDDLLIVRTSVSKLHRTSMRFEYQVFKKNESRSGVTPPLLATGFSVHVFVDRQMRPTRVPSEVEKIVTPFSLLQRN
jgi:acyl-CoA thioester hydrolase